MACSVVSAQPGTTAVLTAGPNPNYVAERLRAHARLCRHIAEEIWSEQKAVELLRMADECTRAADIIAAGTADDPDVKRMTSRLKA